MRFSYINFSIQIKLQLKDVEARKSDDILAEKLAEKKIL